MILVRAELPCSSGLPASQLSPGQENVLQRLRAAFQRLFEIGHQVGTAVHVQVIGHTDTSGSESRNLQLSQQRAEHVLLPSYHLLSQPPKS